ncbi:hypothetical protein COO60DRAFT_1524727 [Scenedesmus sp. NREL 46B-D3]|nr:hypothetical protein COO60DRAFT_1524727 [Scenedesmus sp. NREL 46B-D3]
MLLWMAALCGMILKLDHSFKVVKRVRDATAHKQFGAVLTVMNEFCQVRCSACVCQRLHHKKYKQVILVTCVLTDRDLP